MSEDFIERMVFTLGFLIVYKIVDFLTQILSLKFAWNILSNSFKSCKFPFGPSVLE